YAGGDIVLEDGEIADAQWYAADDLPMIPPGMSIARRLIDDWIANGERACRERREIELEPPDARRVCARRCSDSRARARIARRATYGAAASRVRADVRGVPGRG